VSRSTITYFPFQDNSNRWYYTESGGNTVAIFVTDTISDEGILYYRISFREARVDTTDDWFKQSLSGIQFAQSLIGSYSLFLPSKIDSASGSFISAASSVRYSYYDSLTMRGTVFHKVLKFQYDRPILHGFDEITFADSIGIVELTDFNARWPVTYEIDSCCIFGIVRRF
jgi:hypothetical protein